MKTRIQSILIVITLLFLGLLPRVQSAPQLAPAPDGCYPNYTTVEGCKALNFLTSGAGNTAVGWYSLFSNTDANFNTGVGGGALALNNADSNTAVGAAALLLNTIGTLNTAVGTDALVFNDSGSANSALGGFALFNNTTGGSNTALGTLALYNNSTGSINTAIGLQALQTATSADRNTAVGAYALQDDTIGDRNTAVGTFALSSNTEGAFNTAVGVQALDANMTGSLNTALGVGAGAGVMTASNVTCIGANTSAADVSNTTWITNVYGVTTISGTTLPVIVSQGGQLGTMASSRRFKDEIQPMNEVSQSILALNPVTFHYKSDSSHTPQFGLIAEDVAAVNPDLVVRDKEGKPYSVRYDAVNAMLLNEFVKEHRTVQQQAATIAELKEEVASLYATVKEQAAQIQKVSTQIEMSRPVADVAVNNP
jgi:hypothetical protein